MIKIRYLFVIFLQLIIFCKPDVSISQNKKIIFAKIKDNNFFFVKDTVNFKIDLSKNLFSKGTNVKFDRVEILTQFVNNREFYYVILYDYDKHLKTARILNKMNNELLLSNNNSFEQTYISCVGNDIDCKPNIHYNKLKWFWTCGNKLKECMINSNQKCQSFKTVLF